MVIFRTGQWFGECNKFVLRLTWKLSESLPSTQTEPKRLDQVC